MNPSITFGATGQTYAGSSCGDKLTEFLRVYASREFWLGRHDCGLFLADWFMAATGKPDPAAHLRGTAYEPDDLSILMLPIIETLALPEATPPQRGDIAIVRFGRRELGTICSGARWIALGVHGLRGLPMRLECVRAWKVA